MSSNLFYEALSHCRWPATLQSVLKDNFKTEDIEKYKNKSFDEIVFSVKNICAPVNGVGQLMVYDISSAIFKHFGGNIDKVYLIGNGPRRAIKLLRITNIKTNTKIKFKYVEIEDVINAFDANGHQLDENIKQTTNGDMVESFLCKWQSKYEYKYSI